MKTTTKSFKLFVLLVLAMGFQQLFSQTCTANFNYYVSPGGVVNFTSTSLGTNSITTQYYWTFNGGSPGTYTGTGNAGKYASATYSASGIYSVTLFFLTVPSCSAQVTQTIAVSYTPLPCSITLNTVAASNSVTCDGQATITGAPGMCAPVTFTWFPGGSNSSFNMNLCPGTIYTVMASGSSGTNCCASASQTFAMNSTPCPLNAGFTYTQGLNGLVNFVNTSTGTNSLTTYFWNFGNGLTSNAPNPSHTYTANGQYTVTLWVQNGGPSCINTASTIINVSNVSGNPCNLNAAFIYTTGTNGFVHFINYSSGVVNPSCQWSFGNGQQSNSYNPSYTYTANGVYQVMLIMTDPGPPVCIDTAIVSINITNAGNPCNLSAGFSHSVGTNGVVSFVNSTTGTISTTGYFWNFGDGTTGFGANPNHTYSSSGVYFVIMTAFNNTLNCFNTTSTNINVTGINCVANSNFSLAPTNTAQVWNATPSFPWNINNAVWSWGDGSSSNGLYSSHSYSAAGNYPICLTVTVSCGSTSSTCATYSISKVSTANAMIHINVVPPELVVVGIADQVNSLNGFNFYPNPSNGLLNIELSSAHTTPCGLQIIDLTGKNVFTTLLDASSGQKNKVIDLQHLPNGIYILQLEQAGQRLNKKLVISKD